MRDLEAIGLNMGACLLRARMSGQGTLERRLRLLMENLAATAPTSATGNDPANVDRRVEVVEALLAAADRANAAGDAVLGADLRRAAQDLRVWYHLDDVRSSSWLESRGGVEDRE